MAFSDHMGAFFLVMAAFGGGLIANIYFIQHFYTDQNAAVRQVIPILLGVGTVLPLGLSAIQTLAD